MKLLSNLLYCDDAAAPGPTSATCSEQHVADELLVFVQPGSVHVCPPQKLLPSSFLFLQVPPLGEGRWHFKWAGTAALLPALDAAVAVGLLVMRLGSSSPYSPGSPSTLLNLLYCACDTGARALSLLYCACDTTF